MDTDVTAFVTTLIAVALGATIATLAAMEDGAMTADMLRTGFTYAIAVLILLGAFLLIYQGRGDDAQAWLAIGAVLGYVFRDAGGAASTGQLLRAQASQPTVTATAGPPSSASVTPADPEP